MTGMASTLNWNAKQITLHDGTTIDRATVVVKSNVVTVRPRQGDLIQHDGVVSVEASGRRGQEVATITFATGNVWRVEKAKGCGCR